jgi:ATP-dependent protease ClpP protease subunit
MTSFSPVYLYAGVFYAQNFCNSNKITIIANMNISNILNINISNKVATIDIVGVIGYPAEMQGLENSSTTFAELKAELDAINQLDKEVDTIVINIDSAGGSVDHALSMYHALIQHKAKKIVNYTGISASAATIIGSVAKLEDINIAPYLSILIHEARMGSGGTANQLRADLQGLETINNSIAGIYSNLNGKSPDENLLIMSENNGEGRLLSADEAKELGFVGNVLKASRATALNTKDLTQLNYSKSIINQINNNMGIFKTEKPLKTLGFADKVLAFRELKEGKTVEILDNAETFSGVFDYENQKVTVEENKITNVSEISAQDLEIDNLKAELEAVKLEAEAVKVEAPADRSEEIDALKAELNEAKAIIAEAKLKVSTPILPVAEFKTDSNIAKESTAEMVYRTQQEMEAKRKDKFNNLK